MPGRLDGKIVCRSDAMKAAVWVCALVLGTELIGWRLRK
jgi:hypothetical protein